MKLILWKLWNWLRDASNQGALRIIGATVACLAMATWAIYLHLSAPIQPVKVLDNPRSGVPETTIMPNQKNLSPMEDSLALLDDEELRREIARALGAKDIDRVLAALKHLNSPDVKLEECDLIYGYCIKNGKLTHARAVANTCWQGNQRKKAFEEIYLESLKLPHREEDR